MKPIVMDYGDCPYCGENLPVNPVWHDGRAFYDEDCLAEWLDLGRDWYDGLDEYDITGAGDRD